MKQFLISKIEDALFGIRWLLLLLYVGLIAALGIYIAHFLHEVFDMFKHFWKFYEEQNVFMLFVLELVDMTMISQLVVMTIQGGYSIFVKEFDHRHQARRPRWLTANLGSSEQKIKMGMSIIGIMAVHFLKDFIEGHINFEQLYMRMWMLGAVVVATLSFCVFNLLMHHPMLSHKPHKQEEHH